MCVGILRICNVRAIPTYRVYQLYDHAPINTMPRGGGGGGG